MNINGLLVHADPNRMVRVQRALEGLPGVEVHQTTPDGRLVVTVEDTDGADPGDTVLDIHKLEGVLSAALVFHHLEDEEGAA